MPALALDHRGPASTGSRHGPERFRPKIKLDFQARARSLNAGWLTKNNNREIRMTLTRRRFGIGASGLVLGSIAAPFVSRAGAAESTIRIGVVNSMSGGLAAYAQEGQPAFEYIVKKINAEGGIKSKGGAKIELVLADDTSQPARTAA